jgi:hypothetical protein
MHRIAIAGALALSLAAATTHAAAQAVGTGPVVDTLAIRAHTRFLADDLLAGRGTGTPGEHLAAAYIASQLERIGLQPAGDLTSFLLPVPLRAARIDPASAVSVLRDGAAATFRSGAGFVVNTGGSGAFRDFSGPAAFFGQPIHAARPIAAAGSLAGQVAVFLGPLGPHALDIIPALEAAGATGVIVLEPDSTRFDLFVRSRGTERFFVDATVDDPIWQPALPVLIAGPAMTDALLADIDVPIALIEGTAAEGLDLGRSVDAVIRADIRRVQAANLAAVLTGSDPALRHEFVVYTAHYDHLGISTPDARGDSIYNGFSDNAAGVAMLLAIAESMREAPPARSVAFLFFTGEERGLLGSTFMAAAPPFPLERIAGLINLDAGAPPAPPVSWRIAGGITAAGDTAAPARTARAVAERLGWTANLSAASPNSDYWPFLHRGVPAIFIIPGDDWEDTTPEQRDALRRRWDRYHLPGDHWHPDFPFAGLRRYAEFARLIGLDLAGGR